MRGRDLILALPWALLLSCGYVDNPNVGDAVGVGEGNALALGALRENSSAMGVRDDQNEWSQNAYVQASNTASGDCFGSSVALSDDSNTLAAIDAITS